MATSGTAGTSAAACATCATRSTGAGGVSVLGQGPDTKLADYNGVYRFPLNGQQVSRQHRLGRRRHLVQPGVHRRAARRQRLRRRQPRARCRTSRPTAATSRSPTCSASPPTRASATATATRATTSVTAELIYHRRRQRHLRRPLLRRHHRQHLRRAGGRLHHVGAYLLMPHVNVVNRFYSAVPDISNQGYGLTAGHPQR